MKRQQAILDFIDRHNQQKGYSPSTREIGDAVGLMSLSTVHGHLDRLEAKGFIKRKPKVVRAIEVIKNDESEDVVTLMRIRVAIKVLEQTADGTFKTVLIGGERYLLAPMG